MSDNPRPPRWAETPDGIPWQVMYSAFLGVLLSAIMLYGGFYLKRLGGVDAAFGIALIVLSAGLGFSFIALITGARWALSVSRIATMAAAAVMLANLAWQLVLVTRRPEWRLPLAPHAKQLFDSLFEPRPLMLLAGLAACAFLLCLLLGPTVRRHFTRA